MFGALYFVLGLAYVTGQTTQVDRCPPGDTDPPINLFIEGCTTMPCSVVRGEDAIINVIFEAPYTIRSMKTVARLPTFNIPSFPLDENEVTCNHLENTYCPLQKGEIVQYQLRMYIEQIFVTIFPVTVDFFVEDSAQKQIWCARVRIQTTANSLQMETSADNSNRDVLERLLLKYNNSTNL
ncbi:unnamed protein product [Colias eurytheme]|nr:unnamed protein product [Colias eurytheme]